MSDPPLKKTRECGSNCARLCLAIVSPPKKMTQPSSATGGPSDAFMMDWENSIMQGHWDARNGIPKGPRRYQNRQWAELILEHVFPHHSDVTWDNYASRVRNGGVDEWFQLQEEALFCCKHQTGPLDAWYDCGACAREVGGGPMPEDGRWTWVTYPSINGRRCKTSGHLRQHRPSRSANFSLCGGEGWPFHKRS